MTLAELIERHHAATPRPDGRGAAASLLASVLQHPAVAAACACCARHAVVRVPGPLGGPVLVSLPVTG